MRKMCIPTGFQPAPWGTWLNGETWNYSNWEKHTPGRTFGFVIEYENNPIL